jgi:hypothetical protein
MNTLLHLKKMSVIVKPKRKRKAAKK